MGFQECLVAMLCRDSRNRERKDEEAEGAKVQPITARAFGLRSFPCGLSYLNHHQTSSLRSITSATAEYISQSESPASLKSQTKSHITSTMPRQSRGPASAPKRPSVPTPPARSAPQQPAQARQASTVAQPPAAQHAPPPAAAAPQQAAPAASGGSGLFGQMASTAA